MKFNIYKNEIKKNIENNVGSTKPSCPLCNYQDEVVSDVDVGMYGGMRVIKIDSTQKIAKRIQSSGFNGCYGLALVVKYKDGSQTAGLIHSYDDEFMDRDTSKFVKYQLTKPVDKMHVILLRKQIGVTIKNLPRRRNIMEKVSQLDLQKDIEELLTGYISLDIHDPGDYIGKAFQKTWSYLKKLSQDNSFLLYKSIKSYKEYYNLAYVSDFEHQLFFEVPIGFEIILDPKAEKSHFYVKAAGFKKEELYVAEKPNDLANNFYYKMFGAPSNISSDKKHLKTHIKLLAELIMQYKNNHPNNNIQGGLSCMTGGNLS